MTLDQTTKAVQVGMDQGLHIGAQIHVRLAGQSVGDVAIGEARAGTAMTPDTSMIWFSTTKAVTAAAVAQQWERGRLDLDSAVADHVPEFGANGKDHVTIRHCLTHTGGFRFAGMGGGKPAVRDMDESWDDVCAAGLESGWVPGHKAGYHPTSGMTALAKVVEAVDGRRFRDYVRDEIFVPLGMPDCWIGTPADHFDESTAGIMHNTEGEHPVPLPGTGSREGVEICAPGAGGRGPMHQLARFYEALRRGGELEGARVLGPQTVEAITAKHRTGMHDETFGVVIDWGLGFIVDSAIYGTASSGRAFGHGGARSSVGFCDPEVGLVAAVVVNGMAEQSKHYERMASICDAIYADLELGRPGQGRSRGIPGGGLL